jgi:hypothetical protein
MVMLHAFSLALLLLLLYKAHSSSHEAFLVAKKKAYL